jgi:hypothetical protein
MHWSPACKSDHCCSRASAICFCNHFVMEVHMLGVASPAHAQDARRAHTVLAGAGTRTKDTYGSSDTYCFFQNIAGLKVNGKAKKFDDVNVGTYKYYQKFLNLKPKMK